MQSARIASIYCDANKKLIGIPHAKGDLQNYILSDIFFELEPSYSNKELGLFIDKLFEVYDNATPALEGITAMQKYTGLEAYAEAIKEYHLVTVTQEINKSFTFRPMLVDKKQEDSFTDIKGLSVKAQIYNKFVPVSSDSKALAFKVAMDIIAEQG